MIIADDKGLEYLDKRAVEGYGGVICLTIDANNEGCLRMLFI